MIGLGLIGLDLIGLGLIGLGLKSLGLIGLTRPYRTKWFYLTKRLNKCFHMLRKLMEILRPVIVPSIVNIGIDLLVGNYKGYV